MEEDPEAYDCDECEYRIKTEQLSADDHESLTLYRNLRRQVVIDLKLTQLVFDAAQMKLSERQASLLIERLDLIHELRPQSPSSDGKSREDAKE